MVFSWLRERDGFINGTAMCVTHSKEIKFWLLNRETLELFIALSEELGIKSYVRKIPDSITSGLSAAQYGEAFPELIVVKRGSPSNGGGVWLHPDLALQLAQWCSPRFAIQVSRWVREWFLKGQISPSTSQVPPVDQSVYQRIVQNVASEAKESINKISHLTTHKHTHLHKLGQEQLTKTPATADEAQRLVAEILIEAFDSLNKVIGNAVSQHSRLYNLGKKEMAQLLGEAQSVRFELLHSAQLALPTTIVHIKARDRRKIISDFLDQIEIMTEQERQDLLFALPNLGIQERRHGRWSCRLVARHLGLSETQHRTVANIMRERNWSL